MKFAGATLLQLTNHYCRLVVPLLSKDSLCSSLLILQQHGCLITELPRGTTFAELDKAEELKRPIYSIDVDMVLHRLQIGRFIWHASRAVSAANIGEILVEELFMNGRQSFQHLLADVITRLSVGKSTFSLSGQAAADDASSTKVELIKVCFEELVEKGFIIASEKHKPNRRTVLTLPPKSKGAKNKRHLNLEHADTRKKRKLDDNNLNQDDDEEEEEDGEDDGGDAVNSEMQRLLHNSGARDTVNIFENRRFVGDGEWKEDTGFGPDTEEAVFDVEANDAARLLLAQHHQQQEEQEHYQRQQPHRASMELNVASDKGAATVGGLRGMIFKKEPKASIVQRKGVNVQAGGNGNDMDGDHDKESLQTFLAEPEKGICSDETMWTVGWAQMFVVERQNECVKYAKERMQIKAGRIMRILLDTLQLRSVKWDVTMPTELSAPMRLPTIFEEYKLAAETTSPGSPYHGGWERDGSNMASTVAEKPLDLPSLRKLLSSLTEDRCLTETNSGTGSDNIDYQANVGEIINRIKRKTIQSVAAQRFGLPAARIVELLVASDELIEQGRISDMAIMPAREARENLYKLYRYRHFLPSSSFLITLLSSSKLLIFTVFFLSSSRQGPLGRLPSVFEEARLRTKYDAIFLVRGPDPPTRLYPRPLLQGCSQHARQNAGAQC